MELLMPSTGLLFWMTLVFLIVLVIMWRFGFPAISKMVLERKKFIDESLQQAYEAKEKLANIQKESDTILQEAREKQAMILNEAKTTHDAIVAKAKSEAQEEARKLLADAKSTIEAEKKAAIQDIRSQVAVLSVEVAEKVIRQKLNDDKNQMQLINQFLDEISIDKTN